MGLGVRGKDCTLSGSVNIPTIFIGNLNVFTVTFS